MVNLKKFEGLSRRERAALLALLCVLSAMTFGLFTWGVSKLFNFEAGISLWSKVGAIAWFSFISGGVAGMVLATMILVVMYGRFYVTAYNALPAEGGE